MAGQMVALLHKVYVNAGKSAVAEEGTAEAAWFLGGEGVQIDKDYANSLGLVEGEDYGEPDNGLNAYLEQERRNRAAGQMSSRTFVQPAPVSTATVPPRNTYDRETGELLVDPDLAANQSPMPGSLEQPHQTPADKDAAASGTPSEAQTTVTGTTTPPTDPAETAPTDPAATTETPPTDSAPKSTGGSATRAAPAPQTRARTEAENK